MRRRIDVDETKQKPSRMQACQGGLEFGQANTPKVRPGVEKKRSPHFGPAKDSLQHVLCPFQMEIEELRSSMRVRG
jgi:hypothetical protein